MPLRRTPKSPHKTPHRRRANRTRFFAELLESRCLLSTAILGTSLLGTPSPAATTSAAPLPARQIELLGRGVVAMYQGAGSVYVNWRLLATDPATIAFNLYRSTAGNAAVKRNASPITATTDFSDSGVDTTKTNAYFVRPVIDGIEGVASPAFTLGANAEALGYIPIHLQDLNGQPASAKFLQVEFGDLNGDGEYEYVVKWSRDGGHDPGSSHAPSTDTMKIDAYKLDGTFMWRIDLGWNIEVGADYTPMIVYDINGDGRGEVITKTSEGTTDGTGVKIGDTNGDGKTDYRDPANDYRVLSGPEFLSVYSGLTGAEIARTNWPARGNVSDWGDTYGNRVSRNLLGIAYLDGVRPSIVACHGVYALQKVDTWNFRDGSLAKVWSWTNNGTGSSGNQCLRLGDLDGDGKDEIVKGSLVIDDSGATLYDTGLGHGDATVISQFDPTVAGIQVFSIHEAGGPNAVELHDGATGAILWGKNLAGDPSRGPAANIDPRYNSLQCWSASSTDLYDVHGNSITTAGPSGYWGTILWDADTTREIYSEHSNGTNISKWNATASSASLILATGYGGIGTPLVADLLGDWREEFIAAYPNEIRIYSTNIAATSRYYTFEQDPLYRLNVAQWAQRNAASALPSFYFGPGMSAPPAPNIYVVSAALAPPPAPANLSAAKAATGNNVNLAWTASPGAASYDIKRGYNTGGPFQTLATGVTTTSYGDLDVPVGASYVYVVTACSGSGESGNSNEATASFAMPAPWTVQDIGAVGVPGRTTYADGLFTIQGPGPTNANDGVRFASQNLTGDCTLMVYVDSQENVGINGGAGGLMIRKSTSATSAFVDLVASGDGRNHIFLDYRTADGGGKTYKVVGDSAPIWLKLTRVGTTFTGYCSHDKVTWTTVGSVNATMPATVLAGLMETGAPYALCTSRFSGVFPTVAAAASASPNPAIGTPVNLSVLGADDTDEANLSYSWATTGTPPAPVSFSANNSNAAKNTTATFTKAGTYALQVTIQKAGGLSAVSTVNVTVNATVNGRYVFYGGSAFDGVTHDAAIATDKSPLLAAHAAAFANYTSYSRGLNGIMIDIAGPAANLTPADFRFAIGNDDAPDLWPAPATVPSVTNRPGAGVGGSTRIELLWPDNSIQNQWLEVTLEGGTGANSGLAADDVFYFGNAIGESGNDPACARVDAIDELVVRANFTNSASATNRCDFNRDGFVNDADEVLARTHVTWFLNEVHLISPPSTPQASAAAAFASAVETRGVPAIFVPGATAVTGSSAAIFSDLTGVPSASPRPASAVSQPGSVDRRIATGRPPIMATTHAAMVKGRPSPLAAGLMPSPFTVPARASAIPSRLLLQYPPSKGIPLPAGHRPSITASRHAPGLCLAVSQRPLGVWNRLDLSPLAYDL